MLGYRTRPSQTRSGQRVDNPPLANSDTAELKIMVADAVNDGMHDQAGFNREVTSKLETLHHWRTYEMQDKEQNPKAQRREINYVWGAMAFLVTLFGTIIGILFSMVRDLERHVQ